MLTVHWGRLCFYGHIYSVTNTSTINLSLYLILWPLTCIKYLSKCKSGELAVPLSMIQTLSRCLKKSKSNLRFVNGLNVPSEAVSTSMTVKSQETQKVYLQWWMFDYHQQRADSYLESAHLQRDNVQRTLTDPGESSNNML